MVSSSNYQYETLPSSVVFSNIHRNDLNTSETSISAASVVQNLNQLQIWCIQLFNTDSVVDEIGRPYRLHGSYMLLTERHGSEKVFQDLVHQLKILRHNWEWNPRAKVVIVVSQEQGGGTEKVAHDLFEYLWSIRVVNAVLVIPAEGEANLLNIYTFFPYYPPGNCPDKIKASLLSQYHRDDEGNTGFLHEKELFPEKIPDDIKGCPIVISSFELPPLAMRKHTKDIKDPFAYDEGIEVRILFQLGKTTNSKVVFRPPPADGELWGYDVGNGTWVGITGEVQRGLSDISINFMWSRSHLIKEVEDSREYLIDTARWFIACAKPYPRWSSLTRVFRPSLWLGLLTAYLIVGIIIWQVVKINNSFTADPIENQAYSSFQKCLLNFWAIILEESASNNPPHVAVIRGIFLVWVLYCYAINTVYQTFLTTFLINPGLQPQITTEDELLHSGMKFGLEDGIISLLNMDIESRYRHYVTCNNIPGCLHRTATRGDLAVLYSKYIMQYMITVKYLNADAEPIVCNLQEDIANILVPLCLTKGFALRRHYDNMLIHLKEGGIVDFWWNEILYLALLEVARDFNLPAGEYIALSLEHLQSAFYFLIIGLVSSLIVFLMELFWKDRKICRNKKKQDANSNVRKTHLNVKPSIIEGKSRGKACFGTAYENK